jgi:hypothetical protein
MHQGLCKFRKKWCGERESDYKSVQGRQHEPCTESPISAGPQKGKTAEK